MAAEGDRPTNSAHDERIAATKEDGISAAVLPPLKLLHSLPMSYRVARSVQGSTDVNTLNIVEVFAFSL